MQQHHFYKFPAESALDEIAFVTTDKGGIRAYLHAREGTPPEKLQEVVQAVNKEKWSAIPFSKDGKNVLEVRGFSTEKQLTDRLRAKGAVAGTPKLEKDAEAKAGGMWDIINERSLQISGLFYMVGDAGFITYGLKEANHLDVAGGLLYLLGTLSLVTFGRNDQADLQIEHHARNLQDFFMKDNVRIPPSCALHTLAEDKQKGLIGDAYDWLRSHPAEVFNTIYIGAGACIAAAALKHKVLAPPPAGATAGEIRAMRAEGWLDVGLGATTSSVSLLGNIIKEKKRDPDEPLPKGMINKALAWVEEKPLRLTGYGLMVSTLCHAGSTTIAYMDAMKRGDTARLASVPYRALFVGANLVAELLIAFSSKGHGEGVTSDDSVRGSVMALAAETIHKQPPEMREQLIHHAASFLQQPNVLAEAYDDIDRDLRNQIAAMDKNPWVCETTVRPAPSAPTPSPKPAVMASIPGTLMQPATIAAQGIAPGASPA